MLDTKEKCACLSYLNFKWDVAASPKCYLDNHCRYITQTNAATLTTALDCQCLSFYGYRFKAGRTPQQCYVPEPCEGIEPDKASSITNETDCFCLAYLGFKWEQGSCFLQDCTGIDYNNIEAITISSKCKCVSFLDYSWVSEMGKCLPNNPCRGIEPRNAWNLSQ